MSEEDDVKEVRSSDRVFVYPEGFLDPALPRGGVMSPSQVGMYQRCPRQFEFRYIQEVVEAPGISMVKGTAIHKGAEVSHRRMIETGSPPDVKEAMQAVADCFATESLFIENWEGYAPGVVKDKAVASYAAYHHQALPRLRPIHAEKTFAIKVGCVPVRGVIDLIDSVKDTEMSLENDPDNPRMVEVVSDLKTTTKKWPEQKIRYTHQLTFYALAEDTNKVRIDFLVDLKAGPRYEQERSVRTLQDKLLLIEDVEQVASMVKKGDFPRCDPTSWACTHKFCGYYERCRGKV
jgi:hypothetical protein